MCADELRVSKITVTTLNNLYFLEEVLSQDDILMLDSIIFKHDINI